MKKIVFYGKLPEWLVRKKYRKGKSIIAADIIYIDVLSGIIDGTLSGTVSIPQDVTKVRSGVFKENANITNVILPKSLTTIELGAFADCTNLESISPTEQLEKVESGAFARTKWFNDQNDGLIYIGKSFYCYKGVIPQDTNIEIKEGTLYIASISNMGNMGTLSNVKKVTVPASVVELGNGAFASLSGAESITFLGTTPPKFGEYVLDDTNDCPIYVPATAIDAYKAASGAYADRFEAIPEE